MARHHSARRLTQPTWRRASHRRLAGACAMAATAVLLSMMALPASASDLSEEGLWYFDLAHMQAIHDSGVTGDGVTIAVVDLPVNLEVPTLADATVEPQPSPCLNEAGEPTYSSTSTDVDVAAHGTQSVSLLVGSGAGYEGQTGVKGVAPGAAVLTYPVADIEPGEGSTERECPGSTPRHPEDTSGDEDSAALSIEAAIDAGADIISVSLTASSTIAMDHAVARAVREEVIVVASVPNEVDGAALLGSAPSDRNGVVSVNRGDRDGSVPPHMTETDVVAPGYDILHQGYGGDWTRQALADGTSEATPFVAGTLALAMQRYPDATPNQLLQSLIHHTGFEAHDLAYRPAFGYGTVVPESLLAADPTSYPDVNPFVSNYSSRRPTVDWIWDGAAASDTYEPDSRPFPVYTPAPGASSPRPSASATAAAPSAATPTAPAPTDGRADVSAAEATEGAPAWAVPVIGVAVLVATAVAIAMAVTRRRRATD